MTQLLVTPVEALLRLALPQVSYDHRRAVAMDLLRIQPLPDDAPGEVREARDAILGAFRAIARCRRLQ